MQQRETQWGLWGYWWRMLVVGGVAVGSGVGALLLGGVAVMQPLLPVWSRVLLAGAALEVLLMSLLALAYLRVWWPERRHIDVNVSLDVTQQSSSEADVLSIARPPAVRGRLRSLKPASPPWQ